MTSAELNQRIVRLRANVFADPNFIDRIANSVRAGKIAEGAAIEEINEYERNLSRGPLLLSPEQIRDEWQSLSEMLEVSQARLEALATTRFVMGMATLPVAVLLVLGSLAFGWQNSGAAPVVASLVVACLVALATHSYLILRVHQQAALAAERLCEKRVGTLFLKLATGRSELGVSKFLSEQGTAMFLGHQAPETIPLQPGDLPAKHE